MAHSEINITLSEEQARLIAEAYENYLQQLEPEDGCLTYGGFCHEALMHGLAPYIK